MRRPTLLCATSLLVMLATASAQAGLRQPQVPVSGTALATFFASQGQSINVNTDQVDVQQMSYTSTTGFEVRTFATASGISFGLHNAAPQSPKLYMVSPASSAAGWYEKCAFQSAPARLVVNTFDPNDAAQGSVTYNGADRSAFSLYVTAAAGTFYLQDARNAGTAKILAFSGTGARAGWTWFAAETSAGPGGDFSDFVALVNLSSVTTPTQRTAWGRLKQLYH